MKNLVDRRHMKLPKIDGLPVFKRRYLTRKRQSCFNKHCRHYKIVTAQVRQCRCYVLENGNSEHVVKHDKLINMKRLGISVTCNYGYPGLRQENVEPWHLETLSLTSMLTYFISSLSIQVN